MVWKTPTLSAIVRILQNPAYAGAYVFGRWDYSGARRSVKTGKTLPHLRPVAQWPVHLDAHHPGYLTWEESALLQGLVARLRAHDGRAASCGT